MQIFYRKYSGEFIIKIFKDKSIVQKFSSGAMFAVAIVSRISEFLVGYDEAKEIP